MLSEKEKKEIDDKIPKPPSIPFPFPSGFAKAYHDYILNKHRHEEIFKNMKERHITFKKIKD